MKKLILSIAIIGMASLSIFQATSAAFEETVKVSGASFTVGTSSGGGGGSSDTNTSLKMLSDMAGSAAEGNLTDSVEGPSFENIDIDWKESVLVKVHNEGSEAMDLISKVDYVSDPETLRDDLYVEILAWDDIDGDGVLDEGETGTSYGYDTILRWRNDTFGLGLINSGETRGFVMQFDGSGISDVNIGNTAVYDFTITGVVQ